MTALRYPWTWLLLSVAVSTDAQSLVNRLGSPRYADRQAASSELEKLGRDALGALKVARSAKDAEVRNRATLLVERIENDLMVRPTLVRLDFRDQKLSDVVKAMGERTHVPMALFPENARALQNRTITLDQPEPVPFWEALTLLCQAGDVQYNTGMPMGGFGPVGNRASTLNLYQASTALEPIPSSISGPFRIHLTGLQIHRERSFTPPNNAMGGFPGGVTPTISNKHFTASLQILAEPRLNVAMNGPIKLLEAVDEQRQSLLPAPVPSINVFQHNSGYNRYETVAGSSLYTQLPLKFPEHRSRTIKRLRGTIPLVVSARKDDPLVISLANSRGKPFKSGDITLTVAEARPEPIPGQARIEIGIQSNLSGANNSGLAPEFVAAQMMRSPGNPQSQMEILDARGKVIPNWFVSNQNFSPEGLRITIQFAAVQGSVIPAEIRYYELAKATTEAEFYFEDVDMP